MLQQLAEECDFLVPTLRSYLESSSLKYRSSQDGNITTAASGWQRCPALEPGDSWGSGSAHTSMSGRSALCQASYKLNRYVRGIAKGNNPQEFNSKRNSKCKRGLKAGHSSLLICLPIPHTAPALLSCIPVHWKSPVLGGFIKKLFCKAPMLLSRSRTNQKVSPSEETSKPKSNTRQLQKPKKDISRT